MRGLGFVAVGVAWILAACGGPPRGGAAPEAGAASAPRTASAAGIGATADPGAGAGVADVRSGGPAGTEPDVGVASALVEPTAAPAGEAGAAPSELAALPGGASALARKLAKECDEGRERRCAALASFYGPGPCALPWEGADVGGAGLRCDRGVPADPAAVRRLLERACGGGAVSGCARLAPAGAAPDDALRVRLERACADGRVDACRVLLAHEGAVPPGQMPSGDRRLRYLNLACSAGHPDACPGTLPRDATPAPAGAASVASQLPRGASIAVQESARLCDLDHAMMCNYVGMRWALPGLDDALPQDLERARALFARACNARTTVGCVLLGDQQLPADGAATTEPQVGAAIALYRQACERHTLAGCERLATLFEKTGQPPALLEAGALYLEACVGGEASACAGASRLAVIP